MSSVVLMRILESAPDRYEAGMRILSLGAIPRLQAEAAAEAVGKPGARVLEIGCGTGAVTRALLERGARVEAIDQNPEMLDRARQELCAAFAGSVTFREQTASEIDGLDRGAYDAVVASLSLSEMSPSERRFVLTAAAGLLAPQGRLVVVDEVRPLRAWQRIVHAALRFPLALLTWIVTGTTTAALADPSGEMEAAGLRVVREQRSALGTLALVVGEAAT